MDYIFGLAIVSYLVIVACGFSEIINDNGRLTDALAFLFIIWLCVGFAYFLLIS